MLKNELAVLKLPGWNVDMLKCWKVWNLKCWTCLDKMKRANARHFESCIRFEMLKALQIERLKCWVSWNVATANDMKHYQYDIHTTLLLVRFMISRAQYQLTSRTVKLNVCEGRSPTTRKNRHAQEHVHTRWLKPTCPERRLHAVLERPKASNY